jgi:peptidoglycan hydrolase-like protein with peptidoglycan-binding domain
VRNRRADAKDGRDTADAGDLPLPFLLQLLGWSARDAVACAIGVLAAVAILVTVLFLQSGSHPAPMFKSAGAASKAPGMDARPAPARHIESIPLPSPPKAAAPAARTPGEVIADIQRELARRGYYDGVLDGLYGPKTDAAIRDFEHAYGLKPSTQPSEALLQLIIRSPGKVGKGITGTATISHPEDAPPSSRVIAVQRALAEFGYGQIKPTGILDSDTQHAIERLERERRLPITGQMSDRIVRELAAATGRPLE